jgi:hypothetical protein
MLKLIWNIKPIAASFNILNIQIERQTSLTSTFSFAQACQIMTMLIFSCIKLIVLALNMQIHLNSRHVPAKISHVSYAAKIDLSAEV